MSRVMRPGLCFDLVIINGYRTTGTFSVSQILNFTSKTNDPLMNSTLSYGTITLNGTYLFCCSYIVYFLSRNKKVSDEKNSIIFCEYSFLM